MQYQIKLNNTKNSNTYKQRDKTNKFAICYTKYNNPSALKSITPKMIILLILKHYKAINHLEP